LPVIVSEAGLGRLQLLFEPASEPGFPSASSVLEDARNIEARRFLDQTWQDNVALNEEAMTLGPLSEQPPARSMPPVQARLIPNVGSALIGLFPCDDSYEVPAILAYGGWNGCPFPAEHVAILRYWQDRYDARLQAISHDTIEVFVGRPPETDSDALALARDHFSYAEDIPSDTVYPNVGALASVLPVSRHWHFWWD
jgi:hypothetical protein